VTHPARAPRHTPVVVARAAEVEQVRHFARQIVPIGGGLEITGEAGSGKSCLWQLALAECRAAGAHVLQASAVEDELEVELTGLHDLFGREPGADAFFAVDLSSVDRGRRAMEWLRAAAAERPVVLAVDDLQWLDTASRKTLRYAARRLDGVAVSVLSTVRMSSFQPPRSDDALLTHDRIEQLRLGPMIPSELREVLRPRIGPISGPELQRVHELSGGNPFAALEFARHMRSSGLTWDSASFPSVDVSLAERYASLDEGTRQVLNVAALLGRVDVDRLQVLAGRDISRELAIARAAGWLCVGTDLMVRFQHPLLQAAVHTAVPPLRRRDLHARLAATASDPDERARQLALSVTTADANVAAELDEAARRAARQGAPGTAATLMSHSARLTPAGDAEAHGCRQLAEVTFRAASGEPARAVALADRLIATLAVGPTRTAAILQRSFLDLDHSEDVLRVHIDQETDELTRANLSELLGLITGLYRGNLAWGRLYAESGLAVGRRHGDVDLVIRAATVVSTISVLEGAPRPDLVAEAEALAEHRGGPPLGRWPQIFRARQDLWAGHLVRAEHTLVRMRDVFAASGTEFQRPYRLADLAAVALARGELHTAGSLVDDGLEAAADAGNEPARAWLHWVGGTVCALQGDADVALEAADFLWRWGEAHREPARAVMALDIRGQLALATGDAAGAVDLFVEGVDRLSALGYRHPGWLPVLPHAVEAAAAAGQCERCEALVGQLTEQASSLRLPYVDALAVGAGGYLRLAEGDATEAAARLSGSAASLDELGYAVDVARAMLGQARALLRAGQRSAAAGVLEEARRRFAKAGAAAWMARADDELGRVRPAPNPSRQNGEAAPLTPTERRIARLVLAGRRNKEIGAEIFICESTVEAHLTRMYRKLGIRSRAALARALEPHTLRLQA
jgi:DNA-binding NarL/FixJ family response regulator